MFDQHLDGLDAAVETHLSDDLNGRIELPNGEVLNGVPMTMVSPEEAQVFGEVQLMRGRRWLELRVLRCPGLVDRAEVVLKNYRWRVAGAPSRPNDGRWWRAEVEPMGPEPQDPAP